MTLQIRPYLVTSKCWGHSVLQTPALVFVEIDHEIISTAILPLPLIPEVSVAPSDWYSGDRRLDPPSGHLPFVDFWS